MNTELEDLLEIQSECKFVSDVRRNIIFDDRMSALFDSFEDECFDDWLHSMEDSI